ncbi:MAG: polysulfide reductase NrfD [Chloroflexi bacterium]|jgi:Ni/Fe-hydrogenase subunit HybB-like protein|nr:polysulfide reductase NrfD [Chloroflexota bacterium]
MLKVDSRDKAKLIDPLYQSGKGFWVILAVLFVALGWAVYMYIQQITLGLGQTGMNRPVYWGVYMVNFIFFIGISHAGTLISAILRVTGAEWRRPITRVAEAITAFALIVGSLQIIIDMGHPERLLNAIIYGRLQSPILWDIVSVTAYFMGSVTYLYLPVIPDAALLRDNFPENGPKWRKRLYTILALGWRGNRTQWIRLEKVIAIMALLIIPIAVSVHTIISWILATTVQPGWHSTIFGPYFVVGAIFSGIGALFIAMSIMRKTMGLEEYFTEKQYRNLGTIFIVTSIFWMYFTYAEHLTLAAGQGVHEFPVLASKLWGAYAPGFWSMVALMISSFWLMVGPQLVSKSIERWRVFHPNAAFGSLIVTALAGLALYNPLGLPVPEDVRPVLWGVFFIALIIGGVGIAAWFRTRFVAASVTSAVFVLIGMWLERWYIIVPTMTHPYLVKYVDYIPSLTEISETVGSIAIFMIMFVVFFKFFPVISIWEVAEGRVLDQEAEKIGPMPMPEVSSSVRRGRLGFRRTQ